MRLWPQPSAGAPSVAAPSGSISIVGRSCALTREDSDEIEVSGTAAAARAVGPAGAGQRGTAAGKQQQDRAAAALASIAGRARETGSMLSGVGAIRPSEGGMEPDTASEASAAAGGMPRGSLDPPGTLGHRLHELGQQLLWNIDSEYEERQKLAGEKLGACYVAAAEAAAAAAGAGISRGGSFVGYPSMTGSLGVGGGKAVAGSGLGGLNAVPSSAAVGAAVAAARKQLGAGGLGGVSRRSRAVGVGGKSQKASIS